MRRKWLFLPKKNDEIVEKFSKELNVSKITASILLNREILKLEEAYQFLYPSLSNIPSPFLLKDMKKAVERIIDAIKNNEKILIYGDYDVDGITSVALLVNFFNEIDFKTFYYIPKRIEEGYGLNNEAIKKFYKKGIDLIITVDCGVSDFEPTILANQLGIDLIVTDHHQWPGKRVESFALINPNQDGDLYPFKELSGVGVAFNLVIALRASLREKGLLSKKHPNLKRYLDLVAMGTIADMVPLTGVNRIFCKFGLEEITNGDRLGIKMLKRVSGLDGYEIKSGDVGFRLAPRVNASGRVGDPYLGVKLLISYNEEETKNIAIQLNEENEKRKKIEERIFKEILKSPDIIESPAIVLSSSDWHPGVIGIVASRLVELFYKPTILISLKEDKGKGSGRGIEGFDLYKGLKHCEEYLEKFGGHKHAAGINIRKEKIELFKKRFIEIVENEIIKNKDIKMPLLKIDAQIKFNELNDNLLHEIELLSPFGIGNPRPIFCAKEVKVIEKQIVGEDSLRLRLLGDSRILTGFAFQMKPLEEKIKETIDVAFQPRINNFNNIKKIEIDIKDILVS